MAVTEVATAAGSALTPGTEAQLLSFTAPSGGGVYQGVVDISALQDTESIQLTLRSRYKSSGSVRRSISVSASATDDEKIVYLPPLPCSDSVEYEIRALQIGGTGRAFPSSILRIGS